MGGKRKKVHWNPNGGRHGIARMGSSETCESDLVVQKQQRGVTNQGTFKKVTETEGGEEQEGSS